MVASTDHARSKPYASFKTDGHLLEHRQAFGRTRRPCVLAITTCKHCRILLTKTATHRGTFSAYPKFMERKYVTCPETAHLEQVELERTDVGRVVNSCSRFHPPGALTCSRECARRMDRRDRLEVEDQDRVLVLIASPLSTVTQVAHVLAEAMRTEGLIAEIATLGIGAVPPLEDYDAVVIGVASRLGLRGRPFITYLRDQIAALAARPSFLFAVGSRGGQDGDALLRRISEQTDWRPIAFTTFVKAPARQAVFDFARQLSDEIPAAVQPSLG